jgi:cysteinyl-tRNA synthetase
MKPQLHFFNTLSRKIEPFVPLNPPKVTLYTCGPTVYNFAHIGNFRTYVFEDLLRRTLKYFGYNLTHVMNITDIDDKTIKGALEQKISLKEYTQKYTEAFFVDLAKLHIEKAEHYPKATEYVQEMIEMVEKLLVQGFAYRGSDGSVYFAIDRFPDYGCLSHLHLEDLQAGASTRVATDEYDKEQAADFVLWKGYDPKRDGDIYWESPFGKGRPGWHLECSAMAMHILGDTLDIHVGGVDNMFPHHENEIAQSQACSSKKFVNVWLHAEHLLVDHRKMSKSLGNFYTLRDLLDKGYTGTEVRYLLLQTHYKTQANFTLEGLSQARNALQRLKDFILRLQSIKNIKERNQLAPVLSVFKTKFDEALAEDLNIASALSLLFDFVREINSLCDKEQVAEKEAIDIIDSLKELDTVLAILFVDKEEEAPEAVLSHLKQREEARRDKKWKEADTHRFAIENLGYTIEDTPSGSRVKKR